MSSLSRPNAVGLVGVSIVVATAVTGVVADVSTRTVLLQSSVPLAVGIGLVGYGAFLRTREVDLKPRTVLTGTALGLGAFLVVGAWFGLISARPDTSIRLSIVASLSIGSAFGTLVGSYATQLHDANERLRETNRRLKARNDQMDEFVDVASHDLRNPVNVAQGRLELARDERDSEHLRSAGRALDRMDELITDLVSLAKAGDQIRSFEPVDLGAVSEGCWDLVATRDASVSVDTNRTVRADGNRIKQIFENLFRNAVQHGGDGVTVTVGDLPDGFFVEDDGAGIPEELRGAVLEDGFSTSADGVGLGLSIVAQVSQAHGWDVTVTESKTGGARFEFTGVGTVDD
ncbi:HTR-like protein [Halorubrum sp. DM2]|uniref:sensor histidine kinase n=1 Tax=unclassified Halorubrum TaxID=2642239 RepID=UPI00064E1F6B|nr:MULTISPECIES: HAMP domain-containing sensor histidine kinase [unclassified Halorubrum]VTT86002.1 HTR-like protein [Halorubrum sp. DM2]